MPSLPNARFVVAAVLALGCGTGSQDSTMPRAIQLGRSVEALRPLIKEDCHQTEELHYTGEMAAPFDEQLQVNCAGLEVFGARRDVEFMFNDGPLGHVWIHIRGEEVVELRGTLERTFGQVVYETEVYKVFASGTVALRHRPPEVLVATPDRVADLTGYRGGNR